MAAEQTVPFPSSGGFLDAVRTSCEACRQRLKIDVPEAAVDEFLLDLDEATYDRLKDQHGLANMPLNFASPIDELNVVGILSILNFLHCYRLALHERTGRGAWQSIRYFVLAAYISTTDGAASLLSTEGMCAATNVQVAELMGVPLTRERPHESLPIRIGEVDPLSDEIVGKVVGVLRSTGEALRNGGYANLGAFVAEALREGKGSAEVLVERVVRAFPAFRDWYLIQGQPVYLFKKALFLSMAVGQTFSRPGRATPPFPIPQFLDLPVFADNVIPTMMVHFKLIDLAESTDATLARGLQVAPSSAPSRSADGHELTRGVDLSTTSAGAIRAAAVSGCELVVRRAHRLADEHSGRAWLRKMTVSGLDAFLWAVAKDTKELREVPRLTEHGTVMY